MRILWAFVLPLLLLTGCSSNQVAYECIPLFTKLRFGAIISDRKMTYESIEMTSTEVEGVYRRYKGTSEGRVVEGSFNTVTQELFLNFYDPKNKDDSSRIKLECTKK